MSKIKDIAGMIRTRLLTAPAAGEIATLVDLTELYQPNADPQLAVDAIIIDGQKDNAAKVKKVIAKRRGTAILITWTDHAVKDKNSQRPRMLYGYTVEIWSKPIIAGDEWEADAVLESVINRLWQWKPYGGGPSSEVEIRPGGLVPDRTYLVHDLGALVPATH